jgi:NUMOD3 motif
MPGFEKQHFVLLFKIHAEALISNMLKEAGNSLGFIHSEDTSSRRKAEKPSARKKMSEARSGDKNSSFGLTGEKSPNFGRIHSEGPWPQLEIKLVIQIGVKLIQNRQNLK